MATYKTSQKQPNVKQKNVSAPHQKTPRVQLHPVGFPTSSGDLGILRIQDTGIPRMTKAPTRTGDAMSNHVGKVASVLKRAGMKV